MKILCNESCLKSHANQKTHKMRGKKDTKAQHIIIDQFKISCLLMNTHIYFAI